MKIALQSSSGEILESNNLSMRDDDVLILDVTSKELYDTFDKIGFNNICNQFAQYVKNNGVILVPPGLTLKILRKENT